MNNIKFITFGLILLIFGCGESNKDTIRNVDNPEVVAIAFFDALYNEQNIKKAASVCSPKLARILLHYKSTKAVARHMFNMSFDEVDITPDDSGIKVREQFKDSAIITVYFNGYYQSNNLKDVKRLSLIQVDDKWLIDKILKDPF